LQPESASAASTEAAPKAIGEKTVLNFSESNNNSFKSILAIGIAASTLHGAAKAVNQLARRCNKATL
jgi:hypothetical protein